MARRTTVTWLILVVALGPFLTSEAAEIRSSRVLLDRRVHLRSGSVPEWDEFATATPPDHAFELKFDAQSNAKEATLFVRQDDVRHDWSVFLNGKRLGSLFLMEADLVQSFAIQPNTLCDGPNVLTVNPPSENDDIVLHGIWLDSRPPKESGNEATLRLSLIDIVTGASLPGRFTIVDHEGALAPLQAVSNCVVRPGVVYAGPRGALIGLRSGDYTIYGSRGFEWSVVTQKVHLAVGDSLTSSVALSREVPTPGLVACDPHVHTFTHSRHGDATLEERMFTLAGEGIELPVATEHNLLANYSEVAHQLGLERWFTPVIGNETTTAAGHFNVFPVELGSRVPDFRLTNWPALMQSIRSTPGVRVAVLNHPRNVHNGFQPFAAAHFNGVTGENRHGPDFTFDAMELLNSSAQQSDYLLVYRDWFALLNYGHRITAVGSSDCHDVSRYIVGQGRTYITAKDSEPGNINVGEACSNLTAGRASVSMGLLPQVTVNQRFQIGDLVVNAKDSLDVKVTVLGPSWVRCTNVALYANGIKIREKTVTEPPYPGTASRGERASVDWRIPLPTHDVHLVVIATGPGINAPYWAIPRPYQPTSPSWTGRVIGSTNPIWVDADGDGQFSSARAYARRLVAEHGNAPDQLLKALAQFDEAVASQAASLCLNDKARRETFTHELKTAAPQVQRGFAAYATTVP